MNTDNSSWAAVSELFEQLQDTDGEQHEKAILNAGLDPASEELLRKMLLAHRDENFLDRSVDELAGNLLEGGSTQPETIPEDLTGVEFGAWRVSREIDRGGMGAVLLAERADGQFEKTVALKIIKPGRYSPVTRERFQQEMRMLARLEHPNIVRLIDGGINEGGIPWFAMEYVEGQAITMYADQNHLPLNDRITLFIQVCRAVEHAHRNLIIHGDLKPSNILVTSNGQVRLLDFGIGRSLQDDDSPAMLPRFTPRYASPELAGGETMTTASDVFGLCAVLYELISGCSPRDGLSTTTYADYSQYLHTPVPPLIDKYTGSADAQTIAAQRSTKPRQLKRSLKGDLRWILQSGLKVEPDNRFSSAAALREDLDRYLDGRAVNAYPASNTYQLRKFISRFKVPVVAGVLVVVAMIAGTTIARQQAVLAEKEAEKARWASDFLIGIFDEADPWINQQTPISVDEITTTAVTDLLENRQNLAPEVQQAAAAILARVESRLGHLETSKKLLKLQIDLLIQEQGSDDSLALALVNLGIVETNLSGYDAALEAYQQAYALKPLENSVDAISVNAGIQLAYALAAIEEESQARKLVDSLLLHEDSIGEMLDADGLLANLYNTESYLLQLEGDLQASREAARLAFAYAELAKDYSPVMMGKTLLSLAESYHQQGDSVSALKLDQQVIDVFTRFYGVDHPQTIESQARLAVSLSNLGQMAEAIQIYEKVLPVQIATHGRISRYVGATIGNIGSAYLAMAEYQHAFEQYSAAQEIWDSIEPSLPFNIALNQIGLARSLHGLQHLDDANIEFLAALEILDGVVGTSHPVYSRAQIYYLPVLLDLGLLQEAEEILLSAYQTILDAYGLESKHTALAGLRWAQLLVLIDEPEQALDLVNKAITVLELSANRGRHALELEQARELLRILN